MDWILTRAVFRRDHPGATDAQARADYEAAVELACDEPLCTGPPVLPARVEQLHQLALFAGDDPRPASAEEVAAALALRAAWPAMLQPSDN